MAASLGYRKVVGIVALVLFGIAGLDTTTTKTTTNAKEVVATSEWTLLGENDTVAAGMHIRMDISTGQKWVKIPSDDDNNNNNNKQDNVGTTIEKSIAVSSSAGGGGAAVTRIEVEADGRVSPPPEEESLEYDYDMMHRTLSKLPEEEKERMGLPDRIVPIHNDDDDDDDGETKKKKTTHDSAARRLVFEERMKEIWEKRQERLQKYNEDHLADLPQILKDRIQQIQDYLKDPYRHRLLLLLDDDDDDNDNAAATNIVSVLLDLEQQLTDIDMARDFFTLGGLPVLSSLLIDSVHKPLSSLSSSPKNQTTTATTTTKSVEDDEDKIHLVQAYAAWTMGTAVKNIGEFAQHAVAELLVDRTTTTTPLELTWAQFVKASSSSGRQSKARSTKLHKTLYSLGSLLRGNELARSVFASSEAPAHLGGVLRDIAAAAAGEPASSSSVLLLSSSDKTKVAKKLLALAEDMVADATLNNNSDDNPEEQQRAVVEAFATSQWCDSVVALLSFPKLRETALKTMIGLMAFCSSWEEETNAAVAKNALDELQQSWSEDHDMDADIKRERLELVDIAREGLKAKRKD